MLVRKNTKAFKTILQLITACQDRSDRDKLVRLYITKAGDSLDDRISIEGIQGDAALFYEMTYQTVLNNLKSSSHQLQMSDAMPGIYFFHSSANKVWDETPFEFDEAIKQEFSSLPELPMVRKKEPSKKFQWPAAPARVSQKKEKAGPATKIAKTVVKKPQLPDFKLKRPIHFDNLDKLIFRQAKVTRRDILQYYDGVAGHLLPWLKDRYLLARLHAEGGKRVEMTIERLFENNEEDVPGWIKTAEASNKNNGGRLLLCNDKEHLLLYAERGCIEFMPCHSRARNIGCPDYVVMAIESPDSGLEKATEVALASRHVLEGLKLPSFIKTDGVSGFHLYVPLQATSDYATSKKIGEYICKLLKLKMPDLITLKGSTNYVYGKVSLDYTLNEEGMGITAPYSLVAGQSPAVATPLFWDELERGVRVEQFHHKSISERLQQAGDPFEGFNKKKIDAEESLRSLEEHYGFLL